VEVFVNTEKWIFNKKLQAVLCVAAVALGLLLPSTGWTRHPAANARLLQSIPAFEWEGLEDVRADAMPEVQIQIAKDPDFKSLVDEDKLPGVINWYVPAKELAPGQYWWRTGLYGKWSEATRFTIIPVKQEFPVARGSSWAEIQSILAKAAVNTPARVVFEKGVYRLDPDGQQKFFNLNSVSDLVIDGGGSEFILKHPVAWIVTENCERLMIKNMTLDFELAPYAAGRVTQVNEREQWIDVEILPGHMLPDDHRVFQRDKKGMVVTEADDFAMKRGLPLVVAHRKVEHLQGRTYRYHLYNQQASLFEKGDIYVHNPRWLHDAGGDSTYTVEVKGGGDVILFNMTLHSAANECFGAFYSDRHVMINVKLERGEGRVLSANNGGHNHHNCRLGPWIENCLFENTGDDVCHINGYAMAAESQPAPDTFVFNTDQPYDIFSIQAKLDMRPGDRLQFYDRKNGRLIAEEKIRAVQNAGKGKLAVVMEHSIEGVVCGSIKNDPAADYAKLKNEDVTFVFNMSRTCNQNVFRNNTVRNGRRVGILTKGPGGLIENNLFKNLGGGGVEFWNAQFEGLAAEDFVVRNNRIIDCGRITRHHAAIWAEIFKTGGDRLHRNLLIEDNEIINFSGPAMRLSDIDGVVLCGNKIRESGPILKSNVMVIREESSMRRERK
jgi:hypothetical protein